MKGTWGWGEEEKHLCPNGLRMLYHPLSCAQDWDCAQYLPTPSKCLYFNPSFHPPLPCTLLIWCLHTNVLLFILLELSVFPLSSSSNGHTAKSGGAM